MVAVVRVVSERRVQSRCLVLVFDDGVQLAVESTTGIYTRGGSGSNVWSRFFSDDPVTLASREGSPLRRNGRMYSFAHKSIPEYLAACAMWADVVAIAADLRGTSAPAARELHQAVAKALPLASAAAGPLAESASALNAVSLSAQPAVLAFMVEMLHELPKAGLEGVVLGTAPTVASSRGSVVTHLDAVAALHAVVWASRDRSDVAVASANCGSVLTQAGVSLHGVQWDGVCLRGALLSGAVLTTASLRGADLRNCRLDRVFLDGADLDGANLDGVALGLHPTLVGHMGTVRGLALSSDGTTLASCSEDGTVRLWSVVSRRALGTLSGHAKAVVAVALAPDGGLLVSASADGTLRVWSVVTRSCVAKIDLGGDVVAQSVAVKPGGRCVAVGLSNSSVRVYDLDSCEQTASIDGHALMTHAGVQYCAVGDQVMVLLSTGSAISVFDAGNTEKLGVLTGHADAATALCLAVSREGACAAVGSSDGCIRLWDLPSIPSCASSRATLDGHAGPVQAVAFTRDGTALVSASADCTVKLWCVSTRACTGALVGHSGSVTCVAVHPDDARIASGSIDGTIRLWDRAAHTCVKALTTTEVTSVNCIAFSPDGTVLVSGGKDSLLRFWDVSADGGAPTHAVSITADSDTTVKWTEIDCVAFAPDGQSVACGGGCVEDTSITLVAVAEKAVTKSLRGQTAKVRSLVYSADGTFLLSTAGDGIALQWDVSSGSVVTKFVGGHAGLVSCVTYTPDGSCLLSASEDRSVRLWDTATHRCVGALLEHTALVKAVAVSPNGQLVASASSDQSVLLWDFATRSRTKQLAGHSGVCACLSFSANGALLASGSNDASVRVWKVASGNCVTTLDSQGGYVHAVACSADGYTVWSAGGDALQAIHQWDVIDRGDGAFLVGRRMHGGYVAFSPSGHVLATVSPANVVTLWDVGSGAKIAELTGSRESIKRVMFSPDGGKVAAMGEFDDCVRVWNVCTGIATDLRPLGEPVPDSTHPARILTGRSFGWSPCGKHLVCAFTDAVRVFTLGEPASERRFVDDTETADDARLTDFVPSGLEIVTFHRTGMLRFWNVNTGCVVQSLGDLLGCSGLDFSFGDGGTVMAFAYRKLEYVQLEFGVLLVRPDTHTVMQRVSLMGPGLGISPCGTMYATTARRGTVTLLTCTTASPSLSVPTDNAVDEVRHVVYVL